jgi:hypothetical protein
MSTATLGTSGAIDSALRRAFSEASVRLQPDTKISDIVAALAALGVTASVQDGVLILAQGETTMHTVLALRGFASKPENAKFFVLSGQHPKTWSHKEKVEYLKTHSDDDYRKLVQQPVLEAGVKTLDPNMSKSEYALLTRAERVAFIREFGDGAVSHILGRK